MPGVILPFVPGDPNYRIGTTLAGIQYLFDVRWNTRESAWYMAVLQDDETVIRSGIKIVLGAALGAHTVADAWPDGVFYAVDTSGTGVDAGLDDLGDRVQVYWFQAAGGSGTVSLGPGVTPTVIPSEEIELPPYEGP